MTEGPPASAALPRAATSVCPATPDSQWHGYRWDACLLGTFSFVYMNYVTGQQLGSFDIQIQDDIPHLATASGRVWSDSIIFTLTNITGSVPNETVTITPSCANGCQMTATTGNTVYLAPNTPKTIDVDFSDANSTTTDWVYSAFSGTVTPDVPLNGAAPFQWTSPNLRCDQGTGPSFPPKCLFPQYVPTMSEYSLSSTAHGQVAQHIADAQQALQHHWGWQGYGPPLSRTTNQTLSNANGWQACGSWSDPTGLSCDEYPFRSTYQGASQSSDYSIKGVTLAQNKSAGGTLNAWYSREHILDGDQYYLHINP